MSWDRVLPAPAGLHYDSPQVRPSDLLDHKIMSDLPKSHGSLAYRPDTLKYADTRPVAVPQAHQQMAVLNQSKLPLREQQDEMNTHAYPHAHVHGSPNLNPAHAGARPSGPMASPKGLSRSSSSSGSTSPVRSVKERDSFCLCQPDPKVPRPRNAFILYRQHYQATVVAHNPGMANPDISKIIGVQWRNLSEEEKAKWKALAEEEKIRHNQQYPGYRYQPRRSGRDGNSRGPVGISNNPNGGTHCTRCGGRFMHPPSPMTPFTPTGVFEYRPSGLSAPSNHKASMTARNAYAREKEYGPRPIKLESSESRSRSRHGDEMSESSPDMKRRRVSHANINPGFSYRDRSPESPYPTQYASRQSVQQTPNMAPMFHPQRQFNGVQTQAQAQAQTQAQPQTQPQTQPQSNLLDPSLKLPPLQTGTPVMTPVTPQFSEASVETTVMTIPFLNKIKLLAKISPPLLPSFRDASQPRGPVIAVDGQDPDLVQSAVTYLHKLLTKESKYKVRTFDGPDIRPLRQNQINQEGDQMGDATVDYLDTISSWHRISDEIITYVKSPPRTTSIDSRATPEEDREREKHLPSLSPKSLVPKAATMQIHSPAQSSENGSESGPVSPSTIGSDHLRPVPVALVPRYQLTTADAFACSIPINDSYTALDHWQWMASLWRACVGPDITVYVRECTREELARNGGNPVEVRLQDSRTIILRKVGGGGLEEKSLRRVGFEIEDFLMQ